MNIIDKDEWVSVIDCHFCKKQTPTKESFEVQRGATVKMGAKIYGRVCKECHRESQLNKLV